MNRGGRENWSNRKRSLKWASRRGSKEGGERIKGEKGGPTTTIVLNGRRGLSLTSVRETQKVLKKRAQRNARGRTIEKKISAKKREKEGKKNQIGTSYGAAR